MIDEDQEDRDIECLKSHCLQMMEHFDSVQIFATRFNGESDTTVGVTWGGGNWHARYGQVGAWIQKKDRECQLEADKEADE